MLHHSLKLSYHLQISINFIQISTYSNPNRQELPYYLSLKSPYIHPSNYHTFTHQYKENLNSLKYIKIYNRHIFITTHSNKQVYQHKRLKIYNFSLPRSVSTFKKKKVI